MLRFCAYGISIQSNQHIPGLLPLEVDALDSPSVRLLIGSTPSWLHSTENRFRIDWYTSKDEQDGNPNLQVWKVIDGKYFHLQYCDGVEFFVDNLGTEIWAEYPDKLTLEDVAIYFLGPILGLVLRLRGTICLHASAVVIQEKVAIFVGRGGAGKSTTAAAFAERGYPVLSDDVVALIDREHEFLVQPSYPRIRLWESSVRALYSDLESLPRLVPTDPLWDKRYLDLNQPGYQFPQQPISLGVVYYINERSAVFGYPLIEPIPAQEQLISLVTNTYINYLLDKWLRATEFELLGRLLINVPMRQITPHQDIDRLPDLIETIITDFHETISTTTQFKDTYA